ncbi:MAG: peptide deformylase [Saprospiraceae bacterium]|jgi:peptide deformylase
MILPIMALGQPVLKKIASPIKADYEGLDQLIENMWETMYNAKGIGLAAPQIGRSIRLFMVDTEQFEELEVPGIKKVFINAEILSEEGEPWVYEEGCLSIPKINGEVMRRESVTIRYMDEQFLEYTETYDDMNARVIQHEYDHIDGILFTELLKPLKRRLLSRKLDNIRKGKISPEYKMKFKL